MNKTIQLTDAERKAIENIDGNAARGKEFGQHRVKSYIGNNTALQFLNAMRLHYALKNIGTTSFIKAENAWYVYGIDGETYRIPEPENGIDTVLDIEFKRKDV